VTFLSAPIKTPIGMMQLIADEHVLLGASFGSLDTVIDSLDGIDAKQKINAVKRIPVISDLIDDYFDGDIEAINSIAVRQPGAPFSQAAWKAMRKIKAGKVISYTDLASRSGSPAAVRAAGTACAKNAIVLVVPCHRVVKTGGALGNYAYGLEKKEWLLHHEGAL